MVKRILKNIKEFRAGDDTLLREVLHPQKHPVTLPYSIAFARLLSGESSKPHRLTSTEVYIFIGGAGNIYVDGKSGSVVAGDTLVVPPDAEQYLENTGDSDLCFYCIVSPPWSEEGEFIDS